MTQDRGEPEYIPEDDMAEAAKRKIEETVQFIREKQMRARCWCCGRYGKTVPLPTAHGTEFWCPACARPLPIPAKEDDVAALSRGMICAIVTALLIGVALGAAFMGWGMR